MNAQEAKRKAQEVNLKSQSGQYIEITLMVAKAADKGEYEMWYYKNILPDVRKELEDNGYTVGETQFDRNETLTKISWA